MSIFSRNSTGGPNPQTPVTPGNAGNAGGSQITGTQPGLQGQGLGQYTPYTGTTTTGTTTTGTTTTTITGLTGLPYGSYQPYVDPWPAVLALFTEIRDLLKRQKSKMG
jgi:hypothetical protein